MDDLYGDLPPASGEVNKESSSFIGGSWSSLSLAKKDKDKDTKNQVNNAKNEVNTAPSSSAKPASSTKFVPSSLLFKPRQTSAAVQSAVASSSSAGSTSSSTQNSRARGMSVDQSLPQNTTVSAAPLEQKYGQEIIKQISVEQPRITLQPSEEEKQEFNMNSSFEVSDPYDPRRPNDYLAYCKEREDASRLEKLAEENRKRLQEMEQARAELERQRKEAAEKKDYQALINTALPESGAGAGRGRGRGVSNLPSWIVQQMKDERKEEPKPAAEPPVAPEQFQDSNVEPVGSKRKISHFSKPSNVILLKNMVPAEEVDESLAFETKMECQKYGPVKNCRIVVVDLKTFPRCTAKDQVRTFVQFERQDAAVRALKEMNGRFFGGRQISASFFDEEKFQRSDLQPDESEF